MVNRNVCVSFVNSYGQPTIHFATVIQLHNWPLRQSCSKPFSSSYSEHSEKFFALQDLLDLLSNKSANFDLCPRQFRKDPLTVLELW